MRRGFTAVELLIAMTLFTVGLLSVIQVIPANRRLLAQSGNLTQAAFLAQEQIESLYAVPFSGLTTGTYAARAAIDQSSSSPYAGYEREITVQNVDASLAVTGTDTGLKLVTVTVYWSEGSVARQYQIGTYLTAVTTGVSEAQAQQVIVGP
jgi:prepilin-type N-terminal cleavage/methylation domain-containing protein